MKKLLLLASISSIMNTLANHLKAHKFFVFATLVPVVLLTTVLMKLQQRKRKLPPSPPGAWPIVGHLLLLGKHPHITMETWGKQVGDIFLLRLGSVRAIVVTSPELAREVLATQDKTWASRPKQKISTFYFAYNYRGITFAPYSASWRSLRKIATLKLLTTKRLEATLRVREEETLQMTKSIVQFVKSRKLVDLKLRLSMRMMNEIFRTVLGCSLSGSVRQGEEDDQGREFKDMIDEAQHLKGVFMLGDFVPWLRPLDVGGIEKRIQVVQGWLDTFLSKVVDEHEAKWRKGPIPQADKDMVDVLLRIMHEQDQNEMLKLDVESIKATVMGMITAGIDTSSITVEWSMAELIRNPNIMRKLTSELDTVVGNHRMVQETDIPNLKYLQAVVKEVFRLHPPAPLLIPHESTQDSEIAGYYVSAGTRLLVNAYAIGRSAQVWENPLDFNPERFMNRPDLDLKGQTYGLLPFGSGRRQCPAIALGTLSVQSTLAVLVHAFAWSLPPGQCFRHLDMTEQFGITSPKAIALTLHAAPRLANINLYEASS